MAHAGGSNLLHCEAFRCLLASLLNTAHAHSMHSVQTKTHLCYAANELASGFQEHLPTRQRRRKRGVVEARDVAAQRGRPAHPPALLRSLLLLFLLPLRLLRLAGGSTRSTCQGADGREVCWAGWGVAR